MTMLFLSQHSSEMCVLGLCDGKVPLARLDWSAACYDDAAPPALLMYTYITYQPDVVSIL